MKGGGPALRVEERSEIVTAVTVKNEIFWDIETQ
jgi:hypothetical protein